MHIDSNTIKCIEKKLVKLIKTKEYKQILLEGHTDNWGTDEYNTYVAFRRAHGVKDFLINLGIDENKIFIVSYGEEKPVCNKQTPTCWAKNRRVDLKLLSK